MSQKVEVADAIQVGDDRAALPRWFASSVTLNIPQAAGPVAFSLVALSLTNEVRGGAAMILAMMIAQIAGAIPLSRAGRSLAPIQYFRALVAFRTVSLSLLTLFAYLHAPVEWLVACAALAGLVNGAAYGELRSLLNHIVPASNMPRALGVASTLNEVMFVLAPIAASGLGASSPMLALLALTILGAVPALLAPSVMPTSSDDLSHVQSSLLTPLLALWLAGAAAGGATVAVIEIGAVAMALKFGHAPTLAFLFTVPLCLASVSGGIWISLRNRTATHALVVFHLCIMTAGSLLVAFGPGLGSAIFGCILVGAVLAPLGTHFALILDELAPPKRRSEVFAMLRTANAVGVIFASGMLTVAPLSSALSCVGALMCAVTIVAAFLPIKHRASA